MPRPTRNIPWTDQIGGVWYAFWYDKTEKRTKRTTLGTRDDSEAQARFAAFLVNREAFLNPGVGLSVHQAVDDYIREHVHHPDQCAAPGRQESAAAKLQEGFKPSEMLLDVDVARCREYGVFRQKQGVSQSTVRRELGTLKAAIGHASKFKRIGPSHTPPTALPVVELPPESEPNDLWLTREELRQAAMLADPELYDFIMLAYYTAGRKESIELLTPFQVDLARNTINLRRRDETPAQKKSKKRRPVVPIDPALRPVVERLLEKNRASGLLFGRKIDFYGPFKKLITGMGIPEKSFPHILRHSRASHLLQDGKSLSDVARLLGDNTATVERVYGHHCPDMLGQRLVDSRPLIADNVVVTLGVTPRLLSGSESA